MRFAQKSAQPLVKNNKSWLQSRHGKQLNKFCENMVPACVTDFATRGSKNNPRKHENPTFIREK